MSAVSRRRMAQRILAWSAGGASLLLTACQLQPVRQLQPGKLQGKITAWMPASCYFCGGAELWNQRYPDTPVEVIKVGDVTAKWQAALRAGEGAPDIYQSQPSQIPKNMLHRQLYDWTDRMSRDIVPGLSMRVKEVFVPFKLREVTHPKRERIYGVPFQLGVVGMYYREDLLRKVGYTHEKLEQLSWEDYVELGRRLKRDLGIPLAFGTPSNTQLFQMLLWQAGGSVTNKTGTEVTLDNAVAGDVMRRIKRLYDEDLVAPMDPGSAPFWTAAREGKVALLWAATWFGGYFHRNLEKPEEGLGQWRNVQLPYLKPGGPRAVNLGGSPLETPAYTKNPDLTWEVLKFTMATVEGALACMKTGTVLANLPALQTPEFQEETWPYAGEWRMNKLWAKYATDVPNTFYFTPVFDEAIEIFSQHQPKILRGEVGIEAGLKAAADDIRKANEQYVRIMERE